MRCGTTILLVLLTLLLVLSLTSCSATNGAQSSEAEVTGPLTEDYDDAPPIITQLVVGTIRLGNGDLAVDAAQAAELLPLWKAYRGLSASDSSSSLELEALVEQIQETMTTEQIEAIAQMRVTGQDTVALAQERGVGMGQGAGGGSLSPEQIAALRAQRGGSGGGQGQRAAGGERGGFPGGAPPGGGRGSPGGVPGVGAPGGGQAPSAEQIATLQAQRGGAGRLFANRALFDALIELVKTRVQ